MHKKNITLITLLLFICLTNHSLIANAAIFSNKIKKIQTYIVKDDVKEATRLLKKIKISSEAEQERVNLLFGDIYVKINRPNKAIEFYEKSYMTTNEEIESLANLGLAEAHLLQGKLKKSINYVEQSLLTNPDSIRAKIILATAKYRNGDKEEALQILDDLYFNHKNNAEVNLAISKYYASFDDNNKAIDILEKFLKRSPDNIKVMNQLADLYWLIGDSKKAIDLKYKIYKHYVYAGNRFLADKTKIWIVSVDPDYFSKKDTPKTISKEKSEEYQKEEVDDYEETKITPKFETINFTPDAGGTGFIIGNGKYVITNHHVINNAKRIAVRNGIGKVSYAKVYDISKKYDLALLELEDPYPKKYAIDSEYFAQPKTGEDVVTIGFPLIGIGYSQEAELPIITQGIISKVFKKGDFSGKFMTTIAINSGNSGGPIFNLKMQLVGIAYATTGMTKEEIEDLLKGKQTTSFGLGITSSKIKEVFGYTEKGVIKEVKYSKEKIYEKTLPSVVIVLVKLNK